MAAKTKTKTKTKTKAKPLHWVDSKVQKPQKSGLYLILQAPRCSRFYQYEIGEYDADFKRWLYLEPSEHVHYWSPLPDFPAYEPMLEKVSKK